MIKSPMVPGSTVIEIDGTCTRFGLVRKWKEELRDLNVKTNLHGRRQIKHKQSASVSKRFKPRICRLNPINTPVGYDEPIHVRVRGNMQDWDWYLDRIRNWICEEEVPPPLTTDIASSSSSFVRALPPLHYPFEQLLAAFKIDKLTSDLAVTDKVHENLANGCVDMEDRLNIAEWNLHILHTRIEQVEARLAAAEAVGVAPDDAPAGDPAEDEDAASDVTTIATPKA
ncbi:hypothetical protein L1987_69190 [Smallanthus sonchifolius]|uniref:Uncharacterized protein n=1 Tax=Smallanthus sonchifolius TaxID=185202 RepID=A0ACB9B6H7_9ASTR|nr:hypothetical protein L1987_69190 [Smallanthus sonchifolius]